MSAFRALIICNSYRRESLALNESSILPELKGPLSDAENVEAWLRRTLRADEQDGTDQIQIKKAQDASAYVMKMRIEELGYDLEEMEQKPLV